MMTKTMRVAVDSPSAGTDAERCLQAIRRISAEIESIAQGAKQQRWTRPIASRNLALRDVLEACEQLREMSAHLDRQLRGRVLEVDRRNLAVVFDLAYDCARAGQVDRQKFVERLTSLFEGR